MKRHPTDVIKDDTGQALTEFVLVIPIILLFFFAMLQYFADVQAAQLGNYAAYEAARVYAVRGCIDTNDAMDKATTAAAMVLAPIARPVPGEIGGDTGISSAAGSVLNDLQSVLGDQFGNFIIGFGMAKYVRLNSDLLGGSVTIATEGSPSQVDCTISYPQPIFMPGLAGMWNMIMGDNIYASMKTLRTGLTGVPSKVLPLYEGSGSLQSLQSTLQQYDPGAASSLSSFVSSLPTVLLPYMNIQSKCSMGFSSWSGNPRLPDDTTDTSGTDTNLSNTAQNVQNYSQANANYTNAVAAARVDCQAATNACGKITVDNATISSIESIPANQRTSAQNSQLSSAQSDLSTQQGNLSTAESNLNTDNGNVKTYADQVNQYQSQINGAVQSSGSGGNSFPPYAESINCPACGD